MVESPASLRRVFFSVESHRVSDFVISIIISSFLNQPDLKVRHEIVTEMGERVEKMKGKKKE
ncbi:hypothetical protein Bca101_043214 [Brassica carinata]